MHVMQVLGAALVRSSTAHAHGIVCPPADGILSAVEQYGYETTSFQVLEPGMRFWSDGSGEGLVAFADTGSAWVSAGAPLCPPDRMHALTTGFVAAARAAGRRVCFCAVEAPFSESGPLRALPIGAQPVWDPNRWPDTLKAVRSLREQLRRARARGVQVRQLRPEELRPGTCTRNALEQLAESWLASKRGPALTFLLDVQLFSYAEERRSFVAERDGVPVGLLSAIPIHGRGGWFFEDIVRAPDAPNGTAETLIDAAMKGCASEGCGHVTMGLVPLSGKLPLWLRAVRRLGGHFYDFDGLLRFREKLRPHAWEPVRICYPGSQSALSAAWDVLASVTGGSPLRHGLAVLRSRLYRTRTGLLARQM